MNSLWTTKGMGGWLLAVVTLTLALTGCGAGPDTVVPGVTPTPAVAPAQVATPSPEPSATAEATPTAEATTTEAVPTPTLAADATVVPVSSITEEAIRIVSEETGIAPEDLQVVSVEEVTWPSSAGGCPEPDRLYQDVIVPGTRIIVEGERQTFYVHGSGSGPLRFCENPEEPVPGGAPVDPDVDAGDVVAVALVAATATIAPSPTSAPTLTVAPTTPAQPTTPGERIVSTPTPSAASSGSPYTDRALALVAERSGVAPGQLRVVSAEEVTWRDSSLGCPQPGRMYMQALVPGTRIIVEGDGQQFYVHGSRLENLFVCDNPQEPITN